MDYTWSTRELPFLDAVVSELERLAGQGFAVLAEVQRITGLSNDDMRRAATALSDDGYIELVTPSGPDCLHWFVTGVDGRARVLVGQWPSPERVAELVIVQLQQTAESDPDEATRSRAREILGLAGKTASSVGVDLLSSVIVKALSGA